MRRKVLVGVIAVVVLLAVSVGLTLVDRRSGTPLDPRNSGRDGSRAVAEVLRDRGVDVRTVSSPQDAADAVGGHDTTLLVSLPLLMSTERLQDLLAEHSDVARFVLVAPTTDQLKAVTGADVTLARTGSADADAGCSLEWARGLRAPASAAYGGVPNSARTCFASARGVSAFEMPARAGRPPVLVLGTQDALTNEHADEGDNAAIALRALGGSERLVWYSGGYDAKAPTAPPVAPAWFVPTLWLLLGAVVVLMVWRGRRLGRLVHEPLPVVVHADETTRARGQLYRRAHDPQAVVHTLRNGSRTRLRAQLGLGPGSGDDALVEAVARATGRPDPEVAELLLDTGGEPSERTLPEFARALTTLERQARS